MKILQAYKENPESDEIYNSKTINTLLDSINQKLDKYEDVSNKIDDTNNVLCYINKIEYQLFKWDDTAITDVFTVDVNENYDINSDGTGANYALQELVDTSYIVDTKYPVCAYVKVKIYTNYPGVKIYNGGYVSVYNRKSSISEDSYGISPCEFKIAKYGCNSFVSNINNTFKNITINTPNVDRQSPTIEKIQFSGSSFHKVSNGNGYRYGAGYIIVTATDNYHLSDTAYQFLARDAEWSSVRQILVTENGRYYLAVRDFVGNITENPYTSISCIADKPCNISANVSYDANKTKATVTISGSSYYSQYDSTIESETPYSNDGENWVSTSSFEITDNGTYTFYYTDKFKEDGNNNTTASIDVVVDQLGT